MALDGGPAPIIDQAIWPVCERPGVLVVDDEHVVRVMLQLGLERHGFDVWLARHGREAIRLYRQHADRIALTLLDVGMPDLDGVQTLDGLREINPEIVACFMSADVGVHESAELLRRGVRQVIAKPFHIDDLVKVLRTLAAQSSCA